MTNAQEPTDVCCSFCEKPRLEVRRLIAGRGDNVFICDECVALATQVNADLDPLRRSLDALVALARNRRWPRITVDELNASLPPEQLSADQIESVITGLSRQGINVIDEHATQIDGIWLFERGSLHDSIVTDVRYIPDGLEVDIDDEWANEGGLGRPEGVKKPLTLCFSSATVEIGDTENLVGGWVSELVAEQNGRFRVAFCDREALIIRAGSASCRRPADDVGA